MAILVTGNTFVTGNQVTAATLNAAVNSSTFDTGAVDNSTTAVSGGAIIVKDGGVTMAKLASASNGQIPVGNGSGFTAATLTAGTNIGITNGAGSISVAFSGVLPVANGGTGGTLPVANGGTGSTTVAGARTAFGIETPARCTATLNRTDDTFTDVAGMSVTLTSGTTYTLEAIISFAQGSFCIPTFRLTGTATASSLDGVYSLNYTGGSLSSAAATGTSLPVDVAGASTGSVISGAMAFIAVTLVCSGSGTLKLQLKGEDATSDVTVKKGSYIKLFAY